MGKYARKFKGSRARDTRIFALLGMISLVISILAWSVAPGVGV